MTRVRVLLAALAVPVTVAAVVLAAPGAQASTPPCTHGAYVGYCGTQVNNGSPVLALDSFRQGFNTNNRVIGWPNSASDPGTDWFQLPYAGNPALGVMFVYAPFGFIVSMCAADPGNARVVLRECNGSNWQRWIAAPVGSTGFFTWRNRATNRILQSGAKGAQLVTVTQPATPAGNQEWKSSN